METQEKKDLVLKMIEQHKLLKGYIRSVSALINDENDMDTEAIDGELEKFGADLEEHLKLENRTFYPELINDMMDKRQNTAKTEDFVAEMDGIGKVVTAFLEKFNTAGNIKNKSEEFKAEFAMIAETLAIRIESEESGVFMYWNIL